LTSRLPVRVEGSSAFVLFPTVEPITVVDHEAECPRKAGSYGGFPTAGKQFSHQAICGITALGAELPKCIDRSCGVHVVVEPLLERSGWLLDSPVMVGKFIGHETC
jgi:hypothetical protein